MNERSARAMQLAASGKDAMFVTAERLQRQQLLQEEGRRQATLARAKAALPDNQAEHARARKIAHRLAMARGPLTT